MSQALLCSQRVLMQICYRKLAAMERSLVTVFLVATTQQTLTTRTPTDTQAKPKLWNDWYRH